MQKAYFPTKHIWLSQGYGAKSGSHKNSFALDLAGNYRPFAPFDCKVTQIYAPKDTSKSREVWLTSLQEVKCANGYCGYLTISITHPADIINMKVGQTFKQFEDLGLTTTKMTGYRDGNHGHYELSLGQKAGWDNDLIKKYKEYINVNKIKLEEYLFITKDTVIEKDTYQNDKYTFIRDNSTEENYPQTIAYNKPYPIYRCDCNIRIRKGAGTNFDIKKVSECNSEQQKALTTKDKNKLAVFKKGTKITALKLIKKSNNEIWIETYSNGFVCVSNDCGIYLTKM